MEFGSEGAPAKTVGEEGKARDEEEREGQGYEGRYVLLMTKDECEEAIVEAGRKDEAERLVEAADREKGEVQRGWTEWLRTRRDPGVTAVASGSQVVRGRRGGQARARKGWRRSVGALGRHEKVKQRIEFLKKADAILQRGVGMQWWFRIQSCGQGG